MVVAPGIVSHGPAGELARCHWYANPLAAVEPVRLNVIFVPGQGFVGEAEATPAVGCPEQGVLSKVNVTDPRKALGEKLPPPQPTF